MAKDRASNKHLLKLKIIHFRHPNPGFTDVNYC